MTTLLTHAWKRVVDVVPFTFDFTQQLQSGETITLATALVSVQVFAGYDPNPSDLLYGGALVDLNNANAFVQPIQHGLDGVVYNLIASVQTSSNRLLFQTCKLAVLLQGQPAVGPIIPFYYTSWPYPVEWSESFQSSVSPQFGHLLLNPAYTEQIKSSILPLFGDIQLGLVTYSNWVPEQLKTSILPLSLVLNYTSSVNYVIPAEQLKTSILPLSLSLTQGAVIYQNYPPEQLKSSILPQSISLT